MANFELNHGIVDVWTLENAQVRPGIEYMFQVLDLSDRYRADFYKDQTTCTNFIISRAFLKLLITNYTGIPVNEQKIIKNAFGKPELPGCDVLFNISRSNGIAVLAFCRRKEIGIDIEDTSQLKVSSDLIDKVFSPSEKAKLAQLEQRKYSECFFHVWTQKEAYLKAVGVGLSQEMREVSVSVIPSDPHILTDMSGKKIHDWKLFTHNLFGSFEMAICAGSEMHKLDCFDLTAFSSLLLPGQQQHSLSARKADFFLAEYKL